MIKLKLKLIFVGLIYLPYIFLASILAGLLEGYICASYDIKNHWELYLKQWDRKMKSWNVFYLGKKIDCVHYQNVMTEEDVVRSLIKDGYPEGIKVKS